MILSINRILRDSKKIKEELNKKSFIGEEPGEEPLNWDIAEQISFSTARELGQFSIFSMRLGQGSRYYIGNNPPRGLNMIKGSPPGSIFKMIRKPRCWYIKMITMEGKETKVYKKRM